MMNSFEYILLLGFTLKLDQITGCYISKNSLNKFEISAVVPRSANDPALVQSIFEIHCHSPEEVEEWVETLQSVITDRNIRAINEKEEVIFLFYFILFFNAKFFWKKINKK